jgi:UDP-glucose 6-dehydrogenase
MKIGFIGQGWIGKNYADDFEKRGYDIVRYSLEPEYIGNKEKIVGCDIVFVAVPTPTTKLGFDDSFLRAALPLVGKGKIAVIKSTLVIDKTKELQDVFKDIIVLHSPEFLSRRSAAHDAQFPERNIVSIPVDTDVYRAYAQKVLDILPHAPFNLVCLSHEAEFIKYSHNINGYLQVVMANFLYDVAASKGMDWNVLKSAFSADKLMISRYLDPLDGNGRGAGGDCFIKDFEAFIDIAKNGKIGDRTLTMLRAIRDVNIELLVTSGKDKALVDGVYDAEYLSQFKR